MKYSRLFIAFFLTVMLFANFNVPVLAMNTGFSIDLLTDEEQNDISKNIEISVLTEEPEKDAIQCFDVSDNGTVVIGSGFFVNKTVCVYSCDGIFQYGFTFSSTGSFGVGLDGNNVIIYFVRSDLAVSVNPQGEIVDIARIQDTRENATHWNKIIDSAKRSVGNAVYELRGDNGSLNPFTSDYSRLVVVSPDGAEVTFYQSTVDSYSIFCLVVGGIAVILLAIGLISVLYIRPKYLVRKKFPDVVDIFKLR